jgi:uncharacterized protein (TIGR03067 family)
MKYRMAFAVALLALAAAGTRGDQDDDLARDRKLIQGSWGVTAYDQDGTALPAELLKKLTVTIQADRLTIRPRVVAQRKPTLKGDRKQEEVQFTTAEGQADEAAYRLDTAKKRKVIELTQDPGNPSRKIRGLYALSGDTLTLCIPLPDRKLPKAIPDAPSAGLVRMVLKRAPAPGPGNP